MGGVKGEVDIVGWGGKSGVWNMERGKMHDGKLGDIVESRVNAVHCPQHNL